MVHFDRLKKLTMKPLVDLVSESDRLDEKSSIDSDSDNDDNWSLIYKGPRLAAI